MGADEIGRKADDEDDKRAMHKRFQGVSLKMRPDWPKGPMASVPRT